MQFEDLLKKYETQQRKRQIFPLLNGSYNLGFLQQCRTVFHNKRRREKKKKTTRDTGKINAH